jgi:hypothetical protein
MSGRMNSRSMSRLSDSRVASLALDSKSRSHLVYIIVQHWNTAVQRPSFHKHWTRQPTTAERRSCGVSANRYLRENTTSRRLESKKVYNTSYRGWRCGRLRAWGLWPIRRDVRLRIRISALFWSIRRWLNGRSLGTGSTLGGHRRGHAYFHDFEPGERRYHERPSRPPDLRGLAYLLVFEHDVDLQPDSLAFDVLEFREGLLGEIDGILGASKRSMSKTFAWSKLGKAVGGKRTYIVGLCRGNVHQSRGIGIGDDVCGNSSSRCGA